MTRYTANIAAFSDSRARAAGLRRGFTLVEVMVAIAIALALIVGISQIFAMAQQTTGGGTTLVKDNGFQRSMQSQFRQDFQQIDIDAQSPGLVIASYAAAAFRNKVDHDTSRDPGTPPDPRSFNNPSSGPPILDFTALGVPNRAYSTSSRIHRLDRLCMFERGTFHRQTADAPNITSQTTTQEAFVWYGHLAVLNDSGVANWDPTAPQTPKITPAGAYLNPGVPTTANPPSNDNNQYASSWVLGRQQILLTNVDTGENMFKPLANNLLPLSITAPVMSSGSSPSVPMFSSRYDMSLSPIQTCQSQFAGYSGTVPWWQQITGLQVSTSGTSILSDQRYLTNVYPTKPAASQYQINPGNWLSGAAAQTAPVFVRGCSQFIVEFAGNYVTQNQDSTKGNGSFGKVTKAVPDPSGKLDFIPMQDANGNWTRQIRWYGFPRDVAGIDPTTGVFTPGPSAQIEGSSSNYVTPDVIPLSMFLQASGFASAAMPLFERNSTAYQSLHLPMASDGDFPMSNTTYSNPKLPMVSMPYVCAWGPEFSWTGINSLPKLIRITVAVDDPNGRLNNEQTFEYVFALPN